MNLFRYLGFLLSGKKSKITSLGQAGLVYDRGGTKYNIDSEIMGKGKADLVVFWKNMHLMDDQTVPISDSDKLIIAKEVVEELRIQGDTAELDPEIF